jgi:hypothetical protein
MGIPRFTRFTAGGLFALLAACSGSTPSGVQGDAGTDATGATVVDAPGDAPSGACPARPGIAGTPCDPLGGAAAKCEYGGDAYGQCTTLVYCAADTAGGPFTLRVNVPQPGCGTNPAACPSTFDGLVDGAACPLQSVGDSCTYAAGRCGCGPCIADGGWQSRWKCLRWSEAGENCPAVRPRIGSACSQEGQVCDWGKCCSGVSLGASEQCQRGVWSAYVSGTCACAMNTCK